MLDLVNDFEEFHYDTETPAFLLLDLVRKYDKKLVDMLPPGFVSSPRPPTTTHSTRLKDKLLAEISELQYHSKGKEGCFVFNSKATGSIRENFLSNLDEIESKTLHVHCESYAKTCSVLKIVSWIPSQSGCTNQFCSTPTSVFYSSLTWRS